jgi:2-hydroxychromene-2-carboxylate isomerase
MSSPDKKTLPTIDFWHDFASSYSYPAAMRIEEAAAAAGVAVRWRPFLLGPIFRAFGWEDSPFNLQPVKGRYMLRDLERIASALGLPFRRPNPFPQRSVLAARVALIGHEAGWGPEFSRRTYLAEFGGGQDIADAAVIADVLTGMGENPAPVMAAAEAPENKLRLRTETEAAERLGLFGAPTFVTPAGELFWGNDRLDQALAWASAEGASAAAR